MFEYEQDIVEKLLASDEQFQSLYERHRALKQQVRDAELGAIALDDARLGTLKREKLLTKDKMAFMIARYRRAAGSAG